MRVAGHVDRCDEQLVEGWITVLGEPETKVSLDVMLAGKAIGHCTADQLREDLRDAEIGDGYCAFSFPMPAFVPKSDLKRIKLRISDSLLYLDMGTGDAADDIGGSARNTVSRFGGLWIDHYDWLDHLALKHRMGELSEEMCLKIFKFARDGYLVIKQAVPSKLIDRLNAELDKMWVSPPPGLLIETFEPDGIMRYMPPNIEYRSGTTKLLDLYAFSSLAREAASPPPVMEFLSAIFEDKPKAFQGLNFWNGSQQAIHKDTAYVKIDSNPMHLAATWLALEDIHAGTGELEYFIGSHRAPDYLFGGTSKWMESSHSEHDNFLESLHVDAKSYDHVKGSFLAEKGDVLIWHADLAHGGAQIKRPDLTRRSMVHHFTKTENEPFYRRNSNCREGLSKHCVFVSQYHDVPSDI